MRWLVVAFATVTIIGTFPSDADKGGIADKLREAARTAGCETPVVEMALAGPDAPMTISVWCRKMRAPVEEGPPAPKVQPSVPGT